MSQVAYAVQTRRGRSRSQNEDAFLADRGSNLFVVCDGVGSFRGGSLAARLAAEVVRSELEAARWLNRADAPIDEALEVLPAAIEKAHWRLRLEAARRQASLPLATTLVAALVLREDAAIAHVGDSRAYAFGSGRHRLLTRDHTVGAGLVEMGIIDAQDLDGHPLRGQLAQSVGGCERLRVDVTRCYLKPGDRLLLCSDGLSSVLTDAELFRYARACGSLHRIAELMLGAACRSGAWDDLTLVLIQRLGKPAPRLVRSLDRFALSAGRVRPARAPSGVRGGWQAGGGGLAECAALGR